MFGSFSDEARRVVADAQLEVFQLGHDAIGSEHFLLALLRAPDPLAAPALHSHQITYVSAVAALAEIVPPGKRDWNTVPEFTPGAIAVLSSASTAVTQRGEASVRPEHLLLEILAGAETNAVSLFAKLGVEPDTLRNDVLRRMESPFAMRVDYLFKLRGRGVAVLGPIESGGTTTNEKVTILRDHRVIGSAIAVVENDTNTWDRPDRTFRLLLTEIYGEDPTRGDSITQY